MNPVSKNQKSPVLDANSVDQKPDINLQSTSKSVPRSLKSNLSERSKDRDATLRRFQEAELAVSESYNDDFVFDGSDFDISFKTKLAQSAGSMIVHSNGPRSESPFVSKISKSLDVEYESPRLKNSINHSSKHRDISRESTRSSPATPSRKSQDKPKSSRSYKINEIDVNTFKEQVDINPTHSQIQNHNSNDNEYQHINNSSLEPVTNNPRTKTTNELVTEKPNLNFSPIQLPKASKSPIYKNRPVGAERTRNVGHASHVRASNFSDPDPNSRPRIYPISETSANNENDSPFIETSKQNNRPIKVHKLRSNHDLKTSQFLPIKPPPISLDSASTPDRNSRHRRNPSVKVSLTPAQRFEKRPGTRSSNALENFQFSTLIGRGAFASVFKGINLKTKQVVAIKQILLEKDQDVMELMGEIDLLKILKHPNIVKYHGFVKTSDSLNIFLEFCSGGSLRQVYKKRGMGLPESQITGIVRSILLGLNYLHEQGVVHRDVKAANVLITENEDIKLADFGVATKVNSQHNTIVGTPNWMAPETVLGGEGLCTASDIWSLGATIIELFTTNPPYHDLNPMATLHAIGTDEHPPLPKNISSMAKDFLLECFQKQPNLRISAKLLLKHKWLTQAMPKTKVSMINIQEQSTSNLPTQSIKSYTESVDENWDHDFDDGDDLKLPNSSKNPDDSNGIDNLDENFKTVKGMEELQPKYSKFELLTKFAEDNEAEIDTNELSSIRMKGIPKLVDQTSHEDYEDPFLEIDIENFDSNELEIQIKMEYLITKFSTRIDLLHKGNEDLLKSLIKITGRMLHLVKKYQISHITLIKDHGILSLLEVLEYTKDYSTYQKLWFNILSILNHLFEVNQSTFENFCLLGGIPLVTQFKGHSWDLSIRLQVIKFIKNFKNSEKALTMLISCGGLKVVTKYAEEDFDTLPIFPLVAIECIHNILSKDLIRSKSDLCRILSKYGVIFWFVVLLNKLVKYPRDANGKRFLEENVSSQLRMNGRLVGTNLSDESSSNDDIDSTIEMIIDIIKYFGQSEPRVRSNIASVDLFKLLMKAYDKLDFNHQLTILKFFKAMSCLSDVLKSLYAAEILEFLAGIMKVFTPAKDHYKEVMNILCPILYNCCYLNHSKELEVVNFGLVPYLKVLSLANLPFKQFVLPILCELVYCDETVRQNLKKYQILDIYFQLLVDPYWQSNSLDSIIHWYQQDKAFLKSEVSQHANWLLRGFMLSKVSNLESSLENYLKLMTVHKEVVPLMVVPELVFNILAKLDAHNKNPVIQLTLLRILKIIILHDKNFQVLNGTDMLAQIHNLMKLLKNGSVLIDELVIEIMEILGEEEF